MYYLKTGSIGMFSISFVIAIIAVVFVALILTYIIRKVLIRKLAKEIRLAQIIYGELKEELFSENWEKLKMLAKNKQELNTRMIELGLVEKFEELAEVLKVSNVLITEFDKPDKNDLSLKEANITMTFINSVIDSNDEDITLFNQQVEQLLIESGYTLAKQHAFQVQPVTKTIEPEKVIKDEVEEVTAEKIETVIADIKETKVEEIKMEFNEENEMVSNDEYSVFTSGLVITGDVSVKTPLLIHGEVNGNIESEKRVELNVGSKVSGNITASEVSLKEGKVIGDIQATGDVFIGENAYVKGAVYANSLTVEGAIEGNIKATGEVKLSNEAEVLGDIKTTLIDIEKGAKVSGALNIGEATKKEISE